MGQGNTGVVLRSGAETTLRYLEAKRKNRKTLTLNKSPLNKSPKKQKHFESSADFTGSAVAFNALPGRSELNADAFSNVVPILTSAIFPAAAVATGPGIPMGAIPVLDNPVEHSSQAPEKKHKLFVAKVFLIVVALGVLVSGITKQQHDVTESLSTTVLQPTVKNVAGLEPALESAKSEYPEKNTTGTNGFTSNSVSSKKTNISLVHNIVELIQKEEFAQDTTLQALLSLWQDVNASTRATLNSTPWFLRFVFALQKRTRQYLQALDSYHADYSIKFNALLNLSVALGVMSRQGIESSIESYHSRQNDLVEQLKSEIAVIEKSSKKQVPTNESIASLSQSFRKQYAVQPEKDEIKKQSDSVSSEHQISQVLVTGDNAMSSKAITAIELETLVTRFVAAYEHGDLKILMSLFSPEAKTNDKSGWHGIREDYKKLFAASSFRLLNIMDMHWSLSHDSMKGIGDYEIAIAMDDAGNARTLHGKIQFVASQLDNEWRITHLYHLER